MLTRFREKFEKDIDKISNPDILSEITNVIEMVEMADRPQNIKNIKKLKGGKNAFRIRIGNYRVGIYIINNVVEFTRVLPRDKIYEYFPD
jgi:mRNA interferase RelE/StbE